MPLAPAEVRPLLVRVYDAALETSGEPEIPVSPTLREQATEHYTATFGEAVPDLPTEIVDQLTLWEELRAEDPNRTDIPSDLKCKAVALLALQERAVVFGLLTPGADRQEPYTPQETLTLSMLARGLNVLMGEIAKISQQPTTFAAGMEQLAEAIRQEFTTFTQNFGQMMQPSGEGGGMLYSPDYTVTFSQEVVRGYEELQDSWYRRIGEKLVPPGAHIDFDDPAARKMMIDLAFAVECSTDPNLARYINQRNSQRTIHFQTVIDGLIQGARGLPHVWKDIMAHEEGDTAKILEQGFNAMYVDGAPIEAALIAPYTIPLRLKNGEVVPYIHQGAEYMDYLFGNTTKLKSREIPTYTFTQSHAVNLGGFTPQELIDIYEGKIEPVDEAHPNIYHLRGANRDLSAVPQLNRLRAIKGEGTLQADGTYLITTPLEKSAGDLKPEDIRSIGFGRATQVDAQHYRMPDGSVKYIGELTPEDIQKIVLRDRIASYDELTSSLSRQELDLLLTDRAWRVNPGFVTIEDEQGQLVKRIPLPAGIDQQWYNDIRTNLKDFRQQIRKEGKEAEPRQELLLKVEGYGEKYMSQLPADVKRRIQDGEIKWEFVFDEEFDPSRPRRIREGERFYTVWGWAKTDKGWAISALPLHEHKLKEMGIEFKDIAGIAGVGPDFKDLEILADPRYQVLQKIQDLVNEGVDFANYDRLPKRTQYRIKRAIGAVRNEEGQEIDTRGRPMRDQSETRQRRQYILDAMNPELLSTLQSLIDKGIDLTSEDASKEIGQATFVVKALQQATPFGASEAWLGITQQSFSLASWHGQDHISEYEVKGTQHAMYDEYYHLGPVPSRDGLRAYYDLLEANKRARLDPIIIGLGKNADQKDGIWIDPTGHTTHVVVPIAFRGGTSDEHKQAADIVEALIYYQAPLRHNLIGEVYDDLETLMMNGGKTDEEIMEMGKKLLGYQLYSQVKTPDELSSEKIWLTTPEILYQLNNIGSYEYQDDSGRTVALDFKKALRFADYKDYFESMGVRVTDDYTKGALGTGAAVYHHNSFRTRLYPGVPKGWKWPGKYAEAAFQQVKGELNLRVAANNALRERTVKMGGIEVKDIFTPEDVGAGVGAYLSREAYDALVDILSFRGAQSAAEEIEYYKSFMDPMLKQVFSNFNFYGAEARKMKINVLTQFFLNADDEISRDWFYKGDGIGEDLSARELMEINPKKYAARIAALRISRLGRVFFPFGSDPDDFKNLTAEEQSFIGTRSPFVCEYTGVPYYLSKVWKGQTNVSKDFYGHRGFPAAMLRAIKETLIDQQLMTINDIRVAIDAWINTRRREKREVANRLSNLK
jgi:hypothetical protein